MILFVLVHVENGTFKRYVWYRVALMRVYVPIEMFRLSNYGTVMYLSVSGDCLPLENENIFTLNSGLCGCGRVILKKLINARWISIWSHFIIISIHCCRNTTTFVSILLLSFGGLSIHVSCFRYFFYCIIHLYLFFSLCRFIWRGLPC